MLRCTIAGLLPLMMSEKYAGYAGDMFANHRKLFDDILRHRSYYILRDMPAAIARELLLPAVSGLIKKQKKTGMWVKKDSERISYDILSALKHAGLLGKLLSEGELKDPLDALKERRSYHAALIRRDIFNKSDEEDISWSDSYSSKIRQDQKGDGSWGGTVVETIFHLDRLRALGTASAAPSIVYGIDYLLRQYHEALPGIHAVAEYGFIAKNMFTSADRNREFEAAEMRYPEWIPRNACYRHLAVIQNSVCLMTLLRLGFEPDARVETALDNLYSLIFRFGGLCMHNIKKPILEGKICL